MYSVNTLPSRYWNSIKWLDTWDIMSSKKILLGLPDKRCLKCWSAVGDVSLLDIWINMIILTLVIFPECWRCITIGNTLLPLSRGFACYFYVYCYASYQVSIYVVEIFTFIFINFSVGFLVQDADIMWFRDPFPRFYEDADFQIACDHFCGDSIDLENNTPNGGFNFVKSNNRTIEFYKFWYSSQENYPGLHDQDVLNNIKYDYFITEIDLKIKFLNTAYFGGFCEPSKDLNYVCTMHANCCFGLDSKVHDLRILLEDWKQFMSLPPTMKRSSMLSWRAPKNCR